MDTLFLGLRVLVSLGAVLGLLWWLQRRFSNTAGAGRNEQVPVRVVGRQPLTPKASVVVVETGGRRFLLGVTEGSVNVLHTADLPPESDSADMAADAGFAASLQAAAAGTPKQPAVTDPTAGPGAGAGMDPAVPATRRAARGAHAEPPAAPVPAKSALSGSILAPETWRQTGEFLRRGRRG